MRSVGAVTTAAGLAAMMTWTGLAQAQYYGAEFAILQMINEAGNRPSDVACQKGTPFTPNAIKATRQVAMTKMRGYWDALASGNSPLDHFLVDKHVRWTSGTTVLDKKTLVSLKDPFVAPDRTMATEPIGYALAGDGLSALGQWQVRDAAGELVGTYVATFDMTKQNPRISTLELLGAQARVEPVVQYCHKPGDVLGYRIKLAREAVSFAAPRLAAAQLAVASAQAKADKARAAAAAAPGDAGKQDALRSAEAELTLANNSARPYQSMADQAQAELDAAQADQARAAAQREVWNAARTAEEAAAEAKP